MKGISPMTQAIQVSSSVNIPNSVAMLAIEAAQVGIAFRWLPSPNQWADRAGQSIEAYVIHIEEGSENATDATFTNISTQVSADFAIAKDGTLHCYVDFLKASAWANGFLRSPNLARKFVADCVSQNINPNRATISIEHEGQHVGQPSKEQLATGKWLLLYLEGVTRLAINLETVLFHHDFDSETRANCPGPALTAFYSNVASTLSLPGAPLAPASPGYIVGPGIAYVESQLHESAASNERGLIYKDTGEEISEAETVNHLIRWRKKDGALLVYAKTGLQF